MIVVYEIMLVVILLQNLGRDVYRLLLELSYGKSCGWEGCKLYSYSTSHVRYPTGFRAISWIECSTPGVWRARHRTFNRSDKAAGGLASRRSKEF